MLNFIKDKKGDERVLSLYLFVIYIIVSIGIVSGVILFYGSPLDTKKAEANILNTRVIDFLINQGKLNQDIFKSDFNAINFCNLYFKDNSFKSNGDEQYAVKIEIFDFDSCLGNTNSLICSNSLKKIILGREDFLQYCGDSLASFSKKGDKIPQCNIREVYTLDNDREVLVRLISAVGKI